MNALPARRRLTAVTFAIALAVGLSGCVTGARGATPAGNGSTTASRCPWVSQSQLKTTSPQALAREVTARMSLAEELHFVILVTRRPRLENSNEGVPRLCIPPLTLEDGPAGVAFGARHVTQLPAPLALAASFDTSLAVGYGRVEGAEARAKGIDVLQGPELNLDRVPESGRAFEAFGEDPVLTGSLGAAVTEGIQSEDVMAQLKHFAVYTQETARSVLDQQISDRVLEELYFRPFATVVEAAHPSSVMCQYGSVNGTNACQSRALFDALASWGFAGFVRSDLRAAAHPLAAFRAGLSLIKPGSFIGLRRAVLTGALPRAVLNAAVEKVLTQMFAFGLVSRPRRLRLGAVAATPAHAAFALRVAERSVVLLDNRHGLLPLSSRAAGSIAVVGPGAGPDAMTAGYGSAFVRAPHRSPLAEIRSEVAPGVAVRAAFTDPPRFSPIPAGDFVEGKPLPPGPPPADERGEREYVDFEASSVPRVDLTASAPGTGEGWHSWDATIAVPVAGLYGVSIVSNGDTFLSVDGRQVYADRGLHARAGWSFALALGAGRPYHLALRWYSRPRLARPTMTWVDETPGIEAAVAAARESSVAVVFAQDWTSEGSDRPNLELPGVQNALISAVSAANPRTVVVLFTEGPVLMPWVGHIGALLEAWYGGEEAGRAVANVLFGRFDPSGHLPVTFPRTANQGPAVSRAAFPGRAGTVTYPEGLDIGYRWYEAKGERPLFAFGYGLSYTTFALSDLRLRRPTGSRRWSASVLVANTGHRAGGTVVQAYIGFPPSAGEPPSQLAAFAPVLLRPGQARWVSLDLPLGSFEAFLDGRFRTVAGSYTVSVGQSSADLPLRATVRAP